LLTALLMNFLINANYSLPSLGKEWPN